MEEALKLDDRQLDALKEAGTIGSGHAALALSQMVGKRINIGVVKIELIPSQRVIGIIGDTKALVAGTYLKLLGDLQGVIMLVFSRQDALAIIDVLLQKEKDASKTITEIGQSAIKEAGNILACSYLNTMGQLLDFKIALSIPKYVFDEAQGVFDEVFEEYIKDGEASMSLVTEFIEASSKIKGYIFLMPKKEALARILKGLKV